MPPISSSPAESHFRDWLRYRLSGCTFAAHFGADDDRLLFYEPEPELDCDVVAEFLDEAGLQQRVGVVLFPRVTRVEEIIEIVRVLDSHPRWLIVHEPAAARHDQEVGIRMAWNVDVNDQMVTHAMGFAPLGYMPVTRRAPYVALAAWTGGHANDVRRQLSETELTMGDAPPRMDRELYSDTLRKTRTATDRLLSENEVEIEAIRRLAFRLPRRLVEAALPKLADKVVPDR